MRRLPLAFVILVACGGSVAPSQDAGGDTGTKADAGADALACTYGPPSSVPASKACTSSAQCTFVLIPISCCKDVAFGVLSASKDAVSNEVGVRTASCPACGCAAQPEDELGKLGVDFTASCDVGKCTAHAK